MSLFLLVTTAFAGTIEPFSFFSPGSGIAGSGECEVSDGDGEGCILDVWGDLRAIQSVRSDFVVDADGTRVGQGPTLDTRARLGGQVGDQRLHVRLEGDAFEGQALGDPWDLQGQEDARRRWQVGSWDGTAFDLRKASAGGRLGPVAVEAGLQTSHWGLGMVANDGDHDPLFGRTDFGDRVLRLRLASRPLNNGKSPLTLILAGDRVVEDELAEANLFGDEAGDVALQVVGAVAWMPRDQDASRGGLYGVYRNQTDADGERKLRVGVVDAYADHVVETGDWRVRSAVEAATIFGQTDLLQTYNSRDGVRVRSGGVTGLLSVVTPWAGLEGIVRGGWASGDGNPDDGVLRDFTYDRDFGAGMTMFDEVQGAIDAQAYNQLDDPENSGGAPEGAEGLVQEGAFGRAVFVQPVLGAPILDWAAIRAGATLSWSTRPVAHPFTTYRNGGNPANHLGQPTDGYRLGTELNWALVLGDQPLETPKVPTSVRPSLMLQGGHVLLSEEMGGGQVSLITATGRVRW